MSREPRTLTGRALMRGHFIAPDGFLTGLGETIRRIEDEAADRPLDAERLAEAREPGDDLTDSQRLLLLAAWFDMWDRPETDRQAILDDARNPGRNDVQSDLRRMAALLARPTGDRQLEKP